MAIYGSIGVGPFRVRGKVIDGRGVQSAGRAATTGAGLGVGAGAIVLFLGTVLAALAAFILWRLLSAPLLHHRRRVTFGAGCADACEVGVYLGAGLLVLVAVAAAVAGIWLLFAAFGWLFAVVFLLFVVGGVAKAAL